MTTKDNKTTKTINQKIADELNIKNNLAIPRIRKIVVNVGAGEAVSNKNTIDRIVQDISIITGQKPIVTKAKKAISAFKIRKGMPIGVKVTLRGKKMNHFYNKLFKIVLPRIRDFRGISTKSFDGLGNINIGLSDQTLFPEIEYDKIDKIRGLQITIVTTAKNKKQAAVLFKHLNLPLKED